MVKHFTAIQYRPPTESEEPSMQQMPVLVAIRKVGLCFVDFAIWGPFQIRNLKHVKCVGLIPGPPDRNGSMTLKYQELKRPSKLPALGQMLGGIHGRDDLRGRLPSHPP